MKKLVDIRIIQTVHGGDFDLDEGCTGKVLLDSNNYFEGVVREHRTIGEDSFIFGHMFDNGDIELTRLAPNDQLMPEHIKASSTELGYCGKSFIKVDGCDVDNCEVLVHALEGYRTRTIEAKEVDKLNMMIKKHKSNLGTVGNKLYIEECKKKSVKQNVKH